MEKITLHSDRTASATSVSNIFIDEYMADANGEFVKVYLYLLRLMNTPDAAFSISSIADRFEHTEGDIRRALSYWERMHLLRLEYDGADNLTGVCLLDSIPAVNNAPGTDEADARAQTEDAPAPAVSKPQADMPKAAVLDSGADTPAPDSAAKNVSVSTPPKKNYSADELLAFQQNDAVAELFFITERYLGRTLTATDIDTILYFYDGLGFSADLIEYLVEVCVSKGHTSIHYIEKVALGWAKDHITTIEQAKEAASQHSETYFTVMKAFGITGRSLVPSETAFLEKWKNTYGFSTELITEACQRTILATHQPSFEYADSILANWLKNGVKKPSDIARLDAAHQSRKKAAVPGNSAPRNKFNNFEQRSYDYDKMEQLLLTTAGR